MIRVIHFDIQIIDRSKFQINLKAQLPLSRHVTSAPTVSFGITLPDGKIANRGSANKTICSICSVIDILQHLRYMVASK